MAVRYSSMKSCLQGGVLVGSRGVGHWGLATVPVGEFRTCKISILQAQGRRSVTASLCGDSPRDSRPVGQVHMRTRSPRAHAYKRPTSPPYPDATGRSKSGSPPAAEVGITERVNARFLGCAD